MTNTDEERVAFEKWSEDRGMNLRRVPGKSCGKGDFYDRKATESAWQAWLARAKAGSWSRSMECAPHDGTPVLVYSTHGNPRTIQGTCCIAEFWDSDQCNDGREWWRVTHDSDETYVYSPYWWQPLPSPPKEDGE